MDDDQFDDLKQLIQTTVLQSEERLRRDLKQDLKQELTQELTKEITRQISDLKNEMVSGFNQVVTDIIDYFDQRYGKCDRRLNDHERRIKTLEIKFGGASQT